MGRGDGEGKNGYLFASLGKHAFRSETEEVIPSIKLALVSVPAHRSRPERHVGIRPLPGASICSSAFVFCRFVGAFLLAGTDIDQIVHVLHAIDRVELAIRLVLSMTEVINPRRFNASVGAVKEEDSEPTIRSHYRHKSLRHRFGHTPAEHVMAQEPRTCFPRFHDFAVQESGDIVVDGFEEMPSDEEVEFAGVVGSPVAHFLFGLLQIPLPCPTVLSTSTLSVDVPFLDTRPKEMASCRTTALYLVTKHVLKNPVLRLRKRVGLLERREYPSRGG